MQLHENPDELFNSAFQLELEGAYPLAAAMMRRAHQAYMQVGDYMRACECLGYEAFCQMKVGAFEAGLRCVLEATRIRRELGLPVSETDLWREFWYYFACNPRRHRLESCLSRLSELAEVRRVGKGDMLSCRANLEECRGEFSAALALAEQSFGENGLARNHLSFCAAACVRSATHCGNEELSAAWYERLQEVADTSAQQQTLVRNSRAYLALFRNDEALLTECVNEGCDSWSLDVRVELLRRGASLTFQVNPCSPDHRARRRLSSGPRFRRYLIMVFHYQLCKVDYYVACLRFIAGLPARDDYFYREPDIPVGTARRLSRACVDPILRKFDVALRRLDKLAGKLDAMMECSYYSELSAARPTRRDRILAIAEVDAA